MAYGEMHADPQEEAARPLADWIVGNRLSEFSPRDVQRNVHCFRHAEELRPALKMLAERGYVREATVAGEAGKTRKTWQVNPILYAEDAAAPAGRRLSPPPAPPYADVDFLDFLPAAVPPPAGEGNADADAAAGAAPLREDEATGEDATVVAPPPAQGEVEEAWLSIVLGDEPETPLIPWGEPMDGWDGDDLMAAAA